MKIKSTFFTKDGTRAYVQVEDVTEQYQDIVEMDGKVRAEQYFQEGIFEAQQMKGYACGVLESLEQSDECPPFLYHEKDILIQIERVRQNHEPFKAEQLKKAFEWGKKHDVYNLDFPEVDWLLEKAKKAEQWEQAVQQLAKEQTGNPELLLLLQTAFGIVLSPNGSEEA